MMYIKAIVYALCLFSGLYFSLIRAQEQSSQGPPPALVRVTEAVTTQMAPMVWVPGTVVSRNDARIAAEVDGRLVKVLEIGSRVESQQTLAKIDDTSLTLEHAEARAQWVRENARLLFAERELERLQDLADKELVTGNRLDQARADRDAALAESEAAKARLNRLDDQLKKTHITAPFSGVISERYRQAGERVETGDEVVRLVDTESLEVQIRVVPDSLPHLSFGTQVNMTNNSTAVMGRVHSIVPVGDDLSRLYDIRIGFDHKNWPAGTTVRVSVPTEATRTVVAVPRDALVLRREGVSVFRVSTSNAAEKVNVETGIAMGPLIEVIGGIEAGDKVIIRGGERLQPGQAVNIEVPQDN